MAYMAGSMTAAMVIIEPIVMSVMYKNAKARNTLIGVSAVLLVVTGAVYAVSDRDRRRRFSAFDNPASLGGDPDVQKLEPARPGNPQDARK